jgi:hypothetical protein
MSAPKNYTVRQFVTKSDEAEVQRVLGRFPLWSRRQARDLVARRNFQRSIKEAGR